MTLGMNVIPTKEMEAKEKYVLQDDMEMRKHQNGKLTFLCNFFLYLYDNQICLAKICTIFIKAFTFLSSFSENNQLSQSACMRKHAFGAMC
jgi:hypothetical protein